MLRFSWKKGYSWPWQGPGNKWMKFSLSFNKCSCLNNPKSPYLFLYCLATNHFTILFVVRWDYFFNYDERLRHVSFSQCETGLVCIGSLLIWNRAVLGKQFATQLSKSTFGIKKNNDLFKRVNSSKLTAFGKNFQALSYKSWYFCRTLIGCSYKQMDSCCEKPNN